MRVTQRRDFEAGVGQTVTDLPFLKLRAWPLCSASWDVLSRTCASGVSAATPSLKTREEKDNKYSVERIHFTSPTQSRGRGKGGGGEAVKSGYIFSFLSLLTSIFLSLGRPLPVAEPLVLSFVEAFRHGWRSRFRKEAPFNLA